MTLARPCPDQQRSPLDFRPISGHLCYVACYNLINQWEFQDPKWEVPPIYKAYIREYPHKTWPYMVQYLHFRILKSPLN